MMLTKVALVTGSAKRLGQAIALRLANEGFFVFIHHLSSAIDAEKTLVEIERNGGQGSLIRGDISKPKQCEAIAKQIRKKSGRLDVLVNNVGLYRTGSLLALSESDLTNLFYTNTLAPIWLLKHCLSLFGSKGGSVVNMGYSGVDAVSGSAHNGAYLASKLALLSLTKSLALELGPKGIRVNMVSPGIMSNSVELPKKISEYAPLGRLGQPKEVADTVAWLTSQQSEYITGINVDVAGGYMLDLRALDPKSLRREITKKKRPKT